jgi:hypothetical protein
LQIDADHFASRRRPERGQRYHGHDNSPAKRCASHAIYGLHQPTTTNSARLRHFVFIPRAALAGQTGPVEPLGDDSFEPVLTAA